MKLNVRIFWAHATECMCAQSTAWIMLPSEGVVGNGVQTYANSQGKKSVQTRRLKERSNLKCCILQARKPNTLPAELLQPHKADLKSAAGKFILHSTRRARQGELYCMHSVQVLPSPRFTKFQDFQGSSFSPLSKDKSLILHGQTVFLGWPQK